MKAYLKRKTTLAALASLGIIAVYVGVQIVGGATEVPIDFYDARSQGALIAQNIVKLSNESSRDLERINAFDREGNTTEALNLTLDVLRRSQEIREEAVKLSQEVERMTKSLSTINNLEARQVALEAISNHLALINRLINYSGSLAELLDVLRNRFSGQRTNVQVNSLVVAINAEVTAINNFSSQASQAMARFDRIVNNQ